MFTASVDKLITIQNIENCKHVQSINHKKHSPILYNMYTAMINSILKDFLFLFYSEASTVFECKTQHVQTLFHLPPVVKWMESPPYNLIGYHSPTNLCLTYVCIAKGKPSAQLINLLHNTCLLVCTGVDIWWKFLSAHCLRDLYPYLLSCLTNSPSFHQLYIFI